MRLTIESGKEGPAPGPMNRLAKRRSGWDGAGSAGLAAAQRCRLTELANTGIRAAPILPRRDGPPPSPLACEAGALGEARALPF